MLATIFRSSDGLRFWIDAGSSTRGQGREGEVAGSCGLPNAIRQQTRGDHVTQLSRAAHLRERGSGGPVRWGAIDVNVVVYTEPALGEGRGQGELDRTLGEAAGKVKNWP